MVVEHSRLWSAIDFLIRVNTAKQYASALEFSSEEYDTTAFYLPCQINGMFEKVEVSDV